MLLSRIPCTGITKMKKKDEYEGRAQHRVKIKASMSNWQCKMCFDITISPRSGELDAPHIVYLNITCGQVWRRLATQTRP